MGVDLKFTKFFWRVFFVSRHSQFPLELTVLVPILFPFFSGYRLSFAVSLITVEMNKGKIKEVLWIILHLRRAPENSVKLGKNPLEAFFKVSQKNQSVHHQTFVR